MFQKFKNLVNLLHYRIFFRARFQPYHLSEEPRIQKGENKPCLILELKHILGDVLSFSLLDPHNTDKLFSLFQKEYKVFNSQYFWDKLKQEEAASKEPIYLAEELMRSITFIHFNYKKLILEDNTHTQKYLYKKTIFTLCDMAEHFKIPKKQFLAELSTFLFLNILREELLKDQSIMTPFSNNTLNLKKIISVVYAPFHALGITYMDSAATLLNFWNSLPENPLTASNTQGCLKKQSSLVLLWRKFHINPEATEFFSTVRSIEESLLTQKMLNDMIPVSQSNLKETLSVESKRKNKI